MKLYISSREFPIESWVVRMSGTRQFEPNDDAIKLSKILFALSFLFPYLIDYANVAELDHLVVYAPLWIFARVEGQIYAGPNPLALIMFFYWTPIVVTGYLSYRFAKGQFSSVKLYILCVIICVSLTIFFILPMMTIPRAMVEGDLIYTTVIPLPIAPALSLLLIPYLRPAEIISPWKDQEVESEHEGAEVDSVWND
jgi:hypothetical protein